MLEDSLEMRGLTDNERLMFQTEMTARRRDTTVGVLLAFFLGSLGAHHFYMKRAGLGILYACFFWTFIPAVIGVLECFFMPNRVREYNKILARDISTTIKAMRGE